MSLWTNVHPAFWETVLNRANLLARGSRMFGTGACDGGALQHNGLENRDFVELGEAFGELL